MRLLRILIPGLKVKKNKLIVLISLTLLQPLFNCCNEKPALTVEKFKDWVQDPRHGLFIKKEVGDIEYSLQYRPYEYIALQELSEKSITRSLIDSIILEIDGLLYFSLVIGDKTPKTGLEGFYGTAAGYRERIEYYSFHMQRDIRLFICDDTVVCALYHLERLYNTAPYNTILLGFPKKETIKSSGKDRPDCDMTISIDDRFMHSGEVRITVKKEDVQEIPHLILK